MGECIIVVDGCESLAGLLRDAFTETGVRVVHCEGTARAMEYFSGNDIAVLVVHNITDNSVTAFLEAVASISPLTFGLVLDGSLTTETAAPVALREKFTFDEWGKDSLLGIVNQGIMRYRINTALIKEDHSLLRSLANSIESRNYRAAGHSDRVADYAQSIAEALNIPLDIQQEIRLGSWLHDCGKINLPDMILNCNGPRSSIDFSAVKKHPEWGVDLIKPSKPAETIRNIVLYHHERFDGNGYPAGYSGTEIPSEARIVAAADIFDDLTSDRQYRKPYHWEKALRIINSMKGNVLDPEIVEVFSDKILVKRGVNVM